MYSQCPECLTIYKVAAETLAKGHGTVRCGHCSAVFDALRTLTEQLPPEPIEYLATHAQDLEPPQLQVPTLRPKLGHAEPLELPLESDKPAPPSAMANEYPGLKTLHTPQFVKQYRRGRRVRTWPWAVGAGMLMISLSAELAYAERDWLLNDVRVRPWLDQICIDLNCHLPLRTDANRLELLSRDIRPHPSVQNALIISATLHNSSDFSQPFPVVEITLSDLDENRVGMRRFQARDYVNDAKTLRRGLSPGANVALVFEVADPGKNAVAFEFKFL